MPVSQRSLSPASYCALSHCHGICNPGTREMLWTGLSCLNEFINSVIWTGNTIDWAPVWCDISTKFRLGGPIGVPVASLCINRRLYHIVCIRVVSATKSDKRRAIIVDLAIGVGIPVLIMALDYIVQGHRFNIYEDVGCLPEADYVWPIYPIIFLPPIVIGLFTATYSIRTIITFQKKRSQFMALLSSNSDFTPNRFLRLMLLAGADVLFTIPISLYIISLDARVPLNPWISWENVHSNFSRVVQVPSLIWRSNRDFEIGVEFGRWEFVFCAFVFFAFFGFTEEARKNYRLALQSVVKRVGISTRSFRSGANSSDFMGTIGLKSKSGKARLDLPLFVHQETPQHHDSFSSMSIAGVGGVLNENVEKSSAPEKSDIYPPSLSLPDIGGALVTGDTKGNTLAPASSQTLSSTSNPTPARTRQNSGPDGIEISSVHHDSSDMESPNPSVIPPSFFKHLT